MIGFLHKPMNNRRLRILIERLAEHVRGQEGFWKFSYGQRELLCITDATHNRMRVMTPIVAAEELSEDDCRRVLEANFDRALDAKFALAQGQLWSLFMHPLAELREEQFVDAVSQVKCLADNYGSTYSSSDLVFGGEH